MHDGILMVELENNEKEYTPLTILSKCFEGDDWKALPIKFWQSLS